MSNKYTIWYGLLFVLLALIFRYSAWLSLPPASIHQWRQADGAALELHYSENPDLFSPEVQNLFQSGDAHAVGEFPWLYWMAGQLKHLPGAPEYPLRWIGLFLLFAGGWAFGWMLLQQVKNDRLAVFGAGMLLTSPILVYYGPGFLPDAPAFCLVLMMGASLVKAIQREKTGWFVLSGLFALLAILTKLSMAVAPLALMISWISMKKAPAFPKPALVYGVTACMTIIICAFYAWAAAYNGMHGAVYFLAATRPVWHYGWHFIRETLWMVIRVNAPLLVAPATYIICAGGIYFMIKNWKSSPYFIKSFIAFLFAGSLGYSLLWFRMLREHDYYYLCLLVLPAFFIWYWLPFASTRFNEKLLSLWLLIGLILNTLYSAYIMEKRAKLVYTPENEWALPPSAFLTSDQTAAAGIPENARVLCPQDQSPDISLFALKRQGWTAWNFGRDIPTDTLTSYSNRFEWKYMALRDTQQCPAPLRAFFPVRIGSVSGWYFFSVEQ